MDTQAEQPSGQTIRAEDIVAAHQATRAKVAHDPFEEMSADARTMVLAMARAADAANAITPSKDEIEKNEPAKEALTESSQTMTPQIAPVTQPSPQLDEDAHSSSNLDAGEIASVKLSLALRSACTLLYGLNILTAHSPETAVLWGAGMACWGYLALRALDDLGSFDRKPEDKSKSVSNLDV